MTACYASGMKRLAQLPDTPMIFTLLDRLDAAGIVASVTREHTPAGLYLGTRIANVWIADAARYDEATAILHAMQERVAGDVCVRCGYDLQGHGGPAICPECGRPAEVPMERAPLACPSCGEEGPADFEVCWNCGADVQPSS